MRARARGTISEMPSCVGAFGIPWLLLILAIFGEGSPAVKKISKTPTAFRYSTDLLAAATDHGGTSTIAIFRFVSCLNVTLHCAVSIVRTASVFILVTIVP